MSPTNYAVPTGNFLDEWLEENQMTRADLARRLGASRKHVSQLVSGKVPLSYELAENLELVTGVPARIWNNYELQYQSDLAPLRKDSVLKARFSDVMRFPIDYLRRRGHITWVRSCRRGARTLGVLQRRRRRFIAVLCATTAGGLSPVAGIRSR